MWQQDPNFPQCQNKTTQFGEFTLEKITSDRGGWRLTKNINPGRHNAILNFTPVYFFDEGIAKKEIELWLETAALLKTDIPANLRIDLIPSEIIHCKYCIVTIGQFVYPIATAYFVNVTAPVELGRWLSVDEQDQFPRIFMCETSAIQEANTWIKERREKADFSEWTFLS